MIDVRTIDTVVLFDQYPFVGGGQTVFLSLIEAATRVASSVIVGIPLGGALDDVIRRRFEGRIKIVEVAEPMLSNHRKNLLDVHHFFAYSLGLLRHWRLTHSADLVYVNGSRQVLGMCLLSLLGRPRRFIYHIHLDHSRLEKILFCIIAYLPGTARVVLNSRFTSHRLCEFLPMLRKNSRLVVVENALDASYSRRSFIDRFQDEVQFLHVAFVGAIRPEKGADFAIRLAIANPRIQLHIIGGEAPGAESFAAQLRSEASANVIFHGATQNVGGLLDTINAQVLLMPSRVAESFGLAVIEGMACSCIGVVANVGALPDIAARTGAILCIDDKAMCATIDRLVHTTKGELRRLAESQFRTTISAYGADRFQDETTALMTSSCHENQAIRS